MTTPISPSGTLQTSTFDLGARFPNVVSADSRPGYKGWMIPKDNLIEVATAIRAEFGEQGAKT